MRSGILGRLTLLAMAGLTVTLAGADAVHARRTQRLPVVTAKAAILVDRQTGSVLWSHHPDVPLPPASTTKVITASLALQSAQLDESFPVTQKAALEPPSKISLRAGWHVRLRDLVYAILLNSANDASVVIAEGLAGSVKDFAARMNVHAYAVGATNSHFVNPNGLPAEDHYASARDLTLLFSHGLKNPEFRQVLGTTATTIVPTLGSSRPISLHTKNRLLTGYPVRVIGKTGWTRAAGKCFVGAGSVDGREVLVAVLGSDDLWGDLRRLMEFGFGRGPEPLPRGSKGTTLVAAPMPPPAYGAGDIDDDDLRYSIRLATFHAKSAAIALQKQVQRQGYKARISAAREGRRTVHRVILGSFRDRKAAQRAVTAITRKIPSLKPQIVGS